MSFLEFNTPNGSFDWNAFSPNPGSHPLDRMKSADHSQGWTSVLYAPVSDQPQAIWMNNAYYAVIIDTDKYRYVYLMYQGVGRFIRPQEETITPQGAPASAEEITMVLRVLETHSDKEGMPFFRENLQNYLRDKHKGSRRI